MPITQVTVFSDRARITRQAKLQLKPGVNALRAPDLPGNAWLRSVRVEAQGAEVVRLETRPVQRERFGIQDVDGWLKDLEDSQDKLVLARSELADVQGELNLLRRLTPAPLVAEKDRKATPPINPVRWRAFQDQIDVRRATLRKREVNLEQQVGKLNMLFQKQQAEVRARDIGGFSDQRYEALMLIEGTGATATLTLTYAMPGAFWKPVYDLQFDPDNLQVTLQTKSAVTQATGEAWDAVRLRLSTAVPGLDIEVPELITWTLGSDREYVPTPRARTNPRRVSAFAPPVPKPRIVELEARAERVVLRQRISTLLALANTSAVTGLNDKTRNGTRGVGNTSLGKGGSGYSKRTTIDFGDDTISGKLTKPDGEYLKPRSRARYSVKLPEPTRPSANLSEESESIVSSAGAALGGLFAGKKERARSASMGLLASNQWAPQRFNDRMLPAVVAGGFDYVYEAPLRASVPSDASGLLVPLDARTFKVTTFYEATPSLSETAYLKASVKNGGRLPILAGPANVFVNGSFAGDAQLRTTGPGGDLELPLGADEDIRLTRTVIPLTKKEGVFIKDDVTEYEVKIEVGNYKSRAVTVRVIDQIPKSNNEKIAVKLLSTSITPKRPLGKAADKKDSRMDGDGLMYWHLDIPRGKTKTLTFRYRIARPADWRLY